MVVLGKLGKSYGLKGWQLFHCYLDEPSSLTEYSQLKMRPPNSDEQAWQSVSLEGLENRGRRCLIHLKGIDDPEEATACCHYELGVLRSQLPPPPEGSYYWHDLIGAQVINMAGDREILLGTIDSLQRAGGKDLMLIKSDGKTSYIPFVQPDYVHSVQLDEKIVRVLWEEDL